MVIQLASLALYAVVLLLSLRTLWLPQMRQMQSDLARVLRAMLIMSACLALAFGILQAAWTLQGECHALDGWESVLWLIFDWSNGLSHLAFVLAVNIWLQWRVRCNGCDLRRGP